MTFRRDILMSNVHGVTVAVAVAVMPLKIGKKANTTQHKEETELLVIIVKEMIDMTDSLE